MAEQINSGSPEIAPEILPAAKVALQSQGVPLEISPDENSSTGGLQQYQVTDAVRAAIDSGMIKNQGAKIFLQSLVQLREADLADARQERQSARAEVERYKEMYFREHTTNAVLTERLRGELRLKKLQNVLITLGGVLLGVGLQPLLTTFSVGYFLVAILGLALLLGGWFYPKDSNE